MLTNPSGRAISKPGVIEFWHGETWAERDAAEYVQWKANGQCWRRGSCIFNHGSGFWSRGTIILFCFESGDTNWRKKALCSPCSKKSEFVWIERPKYRVKKSLQGTCTELAYDLWYPPAWQKQVWNQDASLVMSVISHTQRLVGRSVKRQWKVTEKGSVALKKENIQLRCVSQDSSQRKSILRENGSNHTVKLSKIKMRHAKDRETTGCFAGNRA